jgi:hypothetical protein
MVNFPLTLYRVSLGTKNAMELFKFKIVNIIQRFYTELENWRK